MTPLSLEPRLIGRCYKARIDTETAFKVISYINPETESLMVFSCGSPYGMYSASASAPGGAAVHEPSGCLCLEPAIAVRARGDAGSAWRAPTPRDLTSLLPMLALPIAGTVEGRGGSTAGEGGGGGRVATRGEPRGDGTAVEARADGKAVEARGGGEVGLGLALALALALALGLPPLGLCFEPLSRAASSSAHVALLSAVEGRALIGGPVAAVTWSWINGLSAAPSQKMLTWGVLPRSLAERAVWLPDEGSCGRAPAGRDVWLPVVPPRSLVSSASRTSASARLVKLRPAPPLLPTSSSHGSPWASALISACLPRSATPPPCTAAPCGRARAP